MGSIRKRSDTELLFYDFRINNIRCREQTLLRDTKANRAKMQVVLNKIEKEIANGTFDYARYFPGSNNIAKLAKRSSTKNCVISEQEFDNTKSDKEVINNPSNHPTFKEFALIWVSENEISWRNSHKKTQLDIINGKLIPVFGEKVVSHITKADVLAFRAELAKVPGRKNSTLSPKRINAIMTPLRQILNEAADRYEFNTAYRNIKPLKVPKSDVEPFTIEQVNQIIEHVREDYQNYYMVRFLTGMRTGEIDGLKWKYIDFNKRLILIRETIVNGEETITKNDSSHRDIQMSEQVYQALKVQEHQTRHISEFVYCNKEGKHLDHNNVTKRVWYPLLRHLNIAKRRPYQTRHTAATLWLASGESPEWIARQMGHSTTEMLFRVYSRFVPNLTRNDGSAFEYLLKQHQVGFGTSQKKDNQQKNQLPNRGKSA